MKFHFCETPNARRTICGKAANERLQLLFGALELWWGTAQQVGACSNCNAGLRKQERDEARTARARARNAGAAVSGAQRS
jgi:hypothetical protein